MKQSGIWGKRRFLDFATLHPGYSSTEEREIPMNRRRAEGWGRREFLEWLALAGAAGLLGLRPERVDAEPPPETTKLRLGRNPSLCASPMYLAEDLLQSEGFTDVQYVQVPALFTKALVAGEIDIVQNFIGPLLIRLEAGDPLIILAGSHVGCFELFGTERVRAIHDLKGKTVAVTELGGPEHVFLASMVAYVGLDPSKDINWATYPVADSIPLLAEGKIDGLLGLPPGSQELRAKQIGHVVVDSASAA